MTVLEAYNIIISRFYIINSKTYFTILFSGCTPTDGSVLLPGTLYENLRMLTEEAIEIGSRLDWLLIKLN